MLRPVAETTSIFYWEKSMLPAVSTVLYNFLIKGMLPFYRAIFRGTLPNSGKKWIDYIF